MKKLILLCLLLVGLMSFTTVNLDLPFIGSETVEETTLGYDIVISSSESNIIIPSCTSTVYYMGEPVASFTFFGPQACTLAAQAACDYIQSHGGTCPDPR